MNKDLAAELTQRHDARSLAMDAGYVVQRVGSWDILEGIGPDGGYWFAKSRSEKKRFRTRADAVEHARLSGGDESPFPEKGKEAKKLNPPTADAVDPELKAKRKKLQGLIKYHKDQNAWMLSRRGVALQTDLQKAAQYQSELDALGKDQDMLVPKANDGYLVVAKRGSVELLKNDAYDPPKWFVKGPGGLVQQDNEAGARKEFNWVAKEYG